MSPRGGLAALLALSLGLAGLTACAKGEDANPFPAGTKPPVVGATCDDPVGDIGTDATQATGTQREPAGIDLVHTEAVVTDTSLRASFTTAGPVGALSDQLFVVDAGLPGELDSFELRAAPDAVSASGWSLTLVTNEKTPDGRRSERRAPVDVPVTVDGTTLRFEVPKAKLPPITALRWQFGASEGEDSPDASARFDDCDPLAVAAATPGSTPGTSGAPGPTTPPTTVAVASPGQSLTYKTGTQVTVHGVQVPPTNPKPDATPADAGFQLAAVDAKVCAPADKGVEVRTSFFGVKDTESRIYPIKADATVGAVDPAFPRTQQVAAGDCVRGWITFQIPTDAGLSQVIYSPAADGSNALVWKVD